MNKAIIFMFLIAVLSLGASAIQVDSPTLGGEGQERNTNASTTFTITNNNTASEMTNIVVTPTAGANDQKYRMAFSVPASIPAGGTATVTVNALVPLDHPGIDSNLQKRPVKIGTLTVTGTAGGVQETSTADVFMQAVNQLEIKKARIECETKSESIDDGDKVENLKPGESCTLEVEVENNFDDNDRDNRKVGDISFPTITFRVDSSSRDIDIDDDDDDIDDLEANDEDSVSITIDIDEEAEDRTNSLDIFVSGRDENGALHGEKLTARLEVVRLTHDIQIRRIELAPSRVSNCEASTVKATIGILNQGKRDEDEAAVEVSVPDLRFSKKVTDIQLDKDDSTAASVDIPVPQNTKPGVMRVDIRTFFDAIAPSNSGSVDLTIESCERNATATVPQPTTGQQPQVVVVPNVQTQGVAAPARTSTSNDSVYLTVLAVAVVIAVIVVIVLLAALLRKRQQ